MCVQSANRHLSRRRVLLAPESFSDDRLPGMGQVDRAGHRRVRRQIAVFDLPAGRDPIHAERRRCVVRVRAGERRLRIVSEKHYQLVSPDAVTKEDLAKYRQRLADSSSSSIL